MKLQQRARKFLGRDSDAEEFQVARSEGRCVVDANGKRYIDFLAGWCVGNLGWTQSESVKLSVTSFPTFRAR